MHPSLEYALICCIAAAGTFVLTPFARKLAATLASTGTPALFVHPAEASHGDLGMVVAGGAPVSVPVPPLNRATVVGVRLTPFAAFGLVAVAAATNRTVASATQTAIAALRKTLPLRGHAPFRTAPEQLYGLNRATL